MVTIVFTLRDTNTGITGDEIQEYPDDYPQHVIEFLWSEGNYACDCNRSAFLYAGHSVYRCDNESIELVRAVVQETGQVLCENEKWYVD